jgi:hypothetical protein
MLGTGESNWSRTLTECFRETLERFCAQARVEMYVDKYNENIATIRRRAIRPDYGLLKIALSDLVEESKKAGRMLDAIRFQKELVFVIHIEGSQNDHGRGQNDEDFYSPLDERIFNALRKLCSLMPTKASPSGATGVLSKPEPEPTHE